jgi:hypothetical protein
MSVAATIEILADTSGSPMKLAFEVVNSCSNNTRSRIYTSWRTSVTNG